VVKGIGTDIVNIERIKDSIAKFKEKFQSKIFTSEEWDYCWNKKNPYPSLAARFAAKEAVLKAMGTGKGAIKWLDIEVQLDSKGKPGINLSGLAAETARSQYISNFKLSLSHCTKYAIAFVVAE